MPSTATEMCLISIAAKGSSTLAFSIVTHKDAKNMSRALIVAVFNAPLRHLDEVELPDDAIFVGKT